MADDARRLHFVESDDLADELERIGVHRTDHCVVCDSETPDDQVASLDRRSDKQYDTVCVDCDGLNVGREVEQR